MKHTAQESGSQL